MTNNRICSLKDKQKLFHSLRSTIKDDVCNGKDLSLHFVSSGKLIPKTTESLLPVITGAEDLQAISFDWTKYQEHLQTKVLGHMVFYSDVITSTQAVFDGLVTLFSLLGGVLISNKNNFSNKISDVNLNF